MADQQINIRITGADTLKLVTEDTQKLTAKTEAARLGFWGLGYAAESAAQSLGVPSAISNQLGSSVASLASKLGAGAAAFGVIGLAATAAYAIYEHFIEAEKKKREELEKSVSALLQEVDANDKAALKTEEVTKAQKGLYEAKKMLLMLELPKQIEAETKALAKQEEEYKRMPSALAEVTDEFGQVIAFIGEEEAAAAKQAAQASINVASAHVQLLKAQYSSLLGQGTQTKDDDAQERARANRLSLEASYSASLVQLSKARGDDLVKQQQLELAAFNAAAKAKETTIKDQDEKEKFLAQTRIERQTLQLNQQHAMEEEHARQEEARLQKEEEARQKAEKKRQDALNAEAYYAQASVGLARARGDSLAQLQQAELAAFDAAAAARYATLKIEDEQRSFLAQNEIERQILVLNQTKALEDEKRQYKEKQAALDREYEQIRMEEQKAAWQEIQGLVGQVGGETGKGLGMFTQGLQGMSDIASGEDPYSAEIERLTNYHNQKLELMAQHGASIEEIDRAVAEKELQIERQKNQQKLAMASNAFGTMAGLMYTLAQTQGKHSKAAFVAYKAFAIGQTIIDTYKAAQGAYSAMAGIPIVGPALGAAMAAAAIIAGMARVKAIQSQQPAEGAVASAGVDAGGGASAGAGTISATPSSSATVPETPASQALPPTQVVNVHVYGNIVDHDAFARELVPAIQKATSDGVR